jgi:predicted CoA-binding protein
LKEAGKVTKRADVQDFLDQKAIAVVGVSRSGKKFANMAYKAFKEKGYKVYAVNSVAENIDGEPCYKDIRSLPEQVGAVLIVVKPHETEKTVREAVTAGISRIWLQQGAESQVAIDLCESNGIKVIHHQCIMMFLKPDGFPHNIHRFINTALGKMPK